MVAESDGATRNGIGQKDAPAIVGHLDVVEVGPAVGFDRNGGAEENVVALKAHRAHLAPPIEVFRLPLLEGALQLFVAGQVDVVGNLFVVDDLRHRSPFRKNSVLLRSCRSRTPDAPAYRSA